MCWKLNYFLFGFPNRTFGFWTFTVFNSFIFILNVGTFKGESLVYYYRTFNFFGFTICWIETHLVPEKNRTIRIAGMPVIWMVTIIFARSKTKVQALEYLSICTLICLLIEDVQWKKSINKSFYRLRAIKKWRHTFNINRKRRSLCVPCV